MSATLNYDLSLRFPQVRFMMHFLDLLSPERVVTLRPRSPSRFHTKSGMDIVICCVARYSHSLGLRISEWLLCLAHR